MRNLLIFIAFLIFCPPVVINAKKRDTTSFKATRLIAPGTLIAGGLGIHYFSHDGIDLQIKDWTQDLRGGRTVVPFDDYIQYVPYVLDLGLTLAGAESKHNFGDICIELALSASVAAIVNGGCKVAFGTLRPNEKNYRSFPSGHSCTVFLGAELVRMEYGWGWGAGAYAIAATVGAMRIYRNWHWFSDVLMGAGIGILSAHAGEWLLKPTKSLFGPKKSKTELVIVPSIDPVSGTLCGGLALNF